MPFSIEVKFSPFADIDSVLSGVAFEAVGIINEKISDLMLAPKTGRTYRRNNGTTYTASDTGEAPAVKESQLINSFEEIALSTLEAQLESEVEYGDILQEKRDRPFTEPAVKEAMPEITELVEDRIQRAWR